MGHKITMMLINILKCIWIRFFEFSLESSNISYLIHSSFFGIRIYYAWILITLRLQFNPSSCKYCIAQFNALILILDILIVTYILIDIEYESRFDNLIILHSICKIRIRITFGLRSKLLSKSSNNSSWFMLIE